MTSPINPSEPHNIFLKKKTFSFHSKQVRCFPVPWIDFCKTGKFPRNGHMLQVVSADEFEVGPEDANAEVRDVRLIC